MNEKRRVILDISIPLGKVDWLTKLLYNVCDDGDIKKMEISTIDDSLVVALTEQHVDAIANEAVTYLELESKVREIVAQQNNH